MRAEVKHARFSFGLCPAALTRASKDLRRYPKLASLAEVDGFRALGAMRTKGDVTKPPSLQFARHWHCSGFIMAPTSAYALWGNLWVRPALDC